MSKRTVMSVLPADKQSLEGYTLRLHEAYAAFMAGRPSSEDCELILVDLAYASGYYNTTSPDMPAEQVKYSEGMRAVYGRIVGLADMPLIEASEYRKAVREVQLATGGQL